MSFLAQLRQQPDQQPTAENTLKLHYLLSINYVDQQATLSLRLIESHNGHPIDSGNPYSIEPQHIKRPPPFLDTTGQKILKQLLEDSERWIHQYNGRIPVDQCEQFFSDLIESNYAFIELPSGEKQRISGKTSGTAFPQWVTHADGTQQFRWNTSGTHTIFCVGHNILILKNNTTTASIGKATPSVNPQAIPLAMSQTDSLNPAAVTHFLAAHQESWLRCNLPLPALITSVNTNSIVSPLLHCYTRPSNITGQLLHIIELKFHYSSNNWCTTLSHTNSDLHYWDGSQLFELQRQPEKEYTFREQLASMLGEFNVLNNHQWQSNDKALWQTFMTELRSSLQENGFQFLIQQGFVHHYIAIDDWHVQISDNREDSLQLSVQLHVDGQTIALNSLLDQLRNFNREQQTRNHSELELPDGRLLLIPTNEFSSLADGLTEWIAGSEIRVPRSQQYRLNELQDLLPEKTQWDGDVALLDQAIKLHQAPVLLDRVLNGVKAQLRPYQWLGVCWLQHLKQHRANGLLADDMGLGKTLQTLSHLSLEHQQGTLTQPALIIAPTSLLHSWSEQIERFTPHLRHCVIHGPQRHQHWETLHNYDILISSYPLISNDLPQWKQHPLSWVILDEAQVIKNYRTKASLAVRELKSEHRLCLSGTPVENHLGELWSILDFLMPACLGSYNDFRQTYQKPIEQYSNKDRLQQLLDRIAPFMLRRDKDQVAQDLPAKTEILQTISLNDDQYTFYEQIQTAEWEQWQQESEQQNSGQQHILLLTALLKLRQACCDPALLGENTVSSAKREVCLDMIEELVAEGRAILVFSQFTTMLDLLAENLQEKGIKHLMLTGGTRNRQHVVKAFQQGDAPVFLISLKAGGVGLNLTRADTVIHYDPWWNSAAEQQASDRAHRIGQDKPVFVYKLIAENTIEEKIAQLQQRKALLSQHINHQAQTSSNDFALKLEDLLALWQQDKSQSC